MHPGTRCAVPWRSHHYVAIAPRRTSRSLQLCNPVAPQGFAGDPNPLQDADAYSEAAEIYTQATHLSGLQTRYEMETAFQTEAPAAPGGSVPSQSAVLALLQEHGLSDREAQGLYRDLYSNSNRGSSSFSPPKPAPPSQPQPRQPPPSAFQQQSQPGMRPSQPQAQQPRKPQGNPLSIIPMEATGVQVKRPPPGSRPSGPRPQQQPAMGGCGSVPTGFGSAPGQSSGARRPQTSADDDWDGWSASANVSAVTPGVSDNWDDSSANSIGSAARQGQLGRGGVSEWGSDFNPSDYPALNMSSNSMGGCGSIPNTQVPAAGRAPAPSSRPPSNGTYGDDSNSIGSAARGRGGGSEWGSDFNPSDYPALNMSSNSMGGCGSIPNTQTPATGRPQAYRDDGSNSIGSAARQSRGGGSEWGSDFNPADYPALGASTIGGCGSIPNTQADSPFQQMCGETVQPIPYNPTSDPYSSSSGYSNAPQRPAARQPSSAAPTNAYQSTPSRVQPPSSKPPGPAQQPKQQQQPGSMQSLSPDTAAPPMTLAQLSAKLDRWSRVLPGLNPARLAAADSKFLEADVAQGLRSLITLVTALPSRDVMSMLDRVPRLLWADDLEGRIRRCKDQLLALHPSGDPDIVMDMMAEYPELIFRMEYYTQARIVDDLPIEIQNMMIVADQGIGYAYRYYRNRRTNYKAEMTSDEPFEQQT